MAKQIEGFMGGFQGKLGPVVGYQWNGKWVMRSRPRLVNNPRTEAQQAHREEFREQVRLAAAMRQGVTAGMALAARQLGMTAYNLFVSLNQGCFDDYTQLRIATGPVAPVGFMSMSYDGDNRLVVEFEKNPLHLRADRYDGVRLYIYNADRKVGYLTAPVYRMDGRIAVVLPEWLTETPLPPLGDSPLNPYPPSGDSPLNPYPPSGDSPLNPYPPSGDSPLKGGELAGGIYVYGFVQDEQGRCSESACLGELGMRNEGEELGIRNEEVEKLGIGNEELGIMGEELGIDGGEGGVASARPTPPE